MSVTRVKDVDYLICMRLSEKDLVSLSRVNKYYREVYKGTELWKRKIYALKGKYLAKPLNKAYYVELYNSLQSDFVKQIFLAIDNERSDILSLILQKRDINPNCAFILKKEYSGYEGKCYYSSEKFDPSMPIVYSPITMIIRKGSIEMWNIIKSNKYPLVMQESYYILAIASKNMDILKDLLDFRLQIHSYVLYFALRSYNTEAIQLLLRYVTEETIEQLLDTFFMESDPEYLLWVKVRNDAFATFLIDERVKRNLGFFHLYNLQDNFSKLIKFYL